jgi:hypothetical protein
MGRFSLGLATALLLAQPAGAQEQPLFQPGFTEWTLAGGGGFSVDIGPSNPQVQFLSFTPQWGRVLRPKLEYVVEGNLSRYFGPGGVLVGVLPVGFRIYTGGTHFLPYISLGGGLSYTNLNQLEEVDRNVNFLLQLGFGVRWPARERHYWLIEGRLHHISNAGSAGKNLGINSAMLVIGYGLG